jgi:hypothetical protein
MDIGIYSITEVLLKKLAEIEQKWVKGLYLLSKLNKFCINRGGVWGKNNYNTPNYICLNPIIEK